LIPKLLALPSPAQLEAANKDLQREIVERRRTETALRERSAELSRSNADLERFNRLAVGREQRMIDLKREVNDLLRQVGKPPAYDLSAITQVDG
jgi:predicted RNase H-like nuclease (RuvC/YqgF family)